MKTEHSLHVADSRRLGFLADASVQLIVTSPPYPMIAMWDDCLRAMAPRSGVQLDAALGMEAFESMHLELDRVWAECWRVLAPGGFACINIGDATRSLGGAFRLYPNHARIVMAMSRLGFSVLPDILWRKPTNAPNKFMGSGMLPAGAYVTYEHEYILIFRKGDKRVFRKPADKALRMRSAFFWEERNSWFSDVWMDLRGTTQRMGGKGSRDRSGAFPFELPWRLIHMYSVQGDRVLDPFVGTGTTMQAALAAGRSSVGVELEPSLVEDLEGALHKTLGQTAGLIQRRLESHATFVAQRLEAGKTCKYINEPMGVPVMTRQERGMRFFSPVGLRALASGRWEAEHEPLQPGQEPPPFKEPLAGAPSSGDVQQGLFG